MGGWRTDNHSRFRRKIALNQAEHPLHRSVDVRASVNQHHTATPGERVVRFVIKIEMNIEQECRFECDTLRLYVDALERLNDQYIKENDGLIQQIKVYDPNVYEAPKYISNLKALLTSSILIECQSLLDFHLPKMIRLLAKRKNVTITPFDNTWKKGSIFSWVKYTLKKEIKVHFDFNKLYFNRLQEFYEIRNDQVHHGGYLSNNKKRMIVNKLNGIYVSKYTDLYITEFTYCRLVIDDLESFLKEITNLF